MLKLHDAEINAMAFDWARKTFALDVTPMQMARSSPCRLLFSGVRSLAWTRNDEWGPSASIYNVETHVEGDLQRFLIQMQSGDVIDVLAEDVSELDI
jgi:hypothetical protein